MKRDTSTRESNQIIWTRPRNQNHQDFQAKYRAVKVSATHITYKQSLKKETKNEESKRKYEMGNGKFLC